MKLLSTKNSSPPGRVAASVLYPTPVSCARSERSELIASRLTRRDKRRPSDCDIIAREARLTPSEGILLASPQSGSSWLTDRPQES